MTNVGKIPTDIRRRRALESQIPVVAGVLKALDTGFRKSILAYQTLALQLRKHHDDSIPALLRTSENLRIDLEEHLQTIEGQVRVTAGNVQQMSICLQELQSKETETTAKSQRRHTRAKNAREVWFLR